MKIGSVSLPSPFVVSPMAGMTDTAFRRLVKRQGGCGLVVSEMVSSEGLVRGIDRTLEYAEYTEEERPVSIQIFGGDPERMAEAARVVEGMGADIVDVNMGCPVPKIAKHHAGCSLMRDPAHAASIVRAMTGAVGIPVTVKMRKGWDETDLSAPEVARRVEGAGAAAITIHGRTARQSYSGQRRLGLRERRGASRSRFPSSGRATASSPTTWSRSSTPASAACSSGAGSSATRGSSRRRETSSNGRPPRAVTLDERGQFLLDYIQLLLDDPAREAEGFRHVAPGQAADSAAPARGRDRWVINKVRALCSWYSKGLEGGSHLRTSVNSAESIAHLRDILASFFLADAEPAIGR